MEQQDPLWSELLDNNVQVVGQPMPGVESAAIGILVGTGARDEDERSYGVSHFTEQMLFRGTEQFDARELSERLDLLGIDYDSTAGLEMTLLNALLIGDRLPQAMELLFNVLRHPSFPEDSMESVRTLLLQELRQREDRPGNKVMDRLRREVFAGTPWSHDTLGTEETLAELTRDQVIDYWHDRYTANNVIVSIAGNFDWDQIVQQLRALTAGWKEGRGRMATAAPSTRSGTVVMEKDMSQETIGFGFPGVSAGDPEYYAAAILAQALGGGMNSRLFREVREQRGLAYSVGARFDGLEHTGLFRISAGTSPERAHESVEVIVEELRKLADGISEEELRLAKTRLKSQLLMRSESTSARMAANLRSWWYERRLYSLDEVKSLIDRVTVADVLSVTERLDIIRNLTIVALGPRPETELLGAVLTRS